VSEARYAIGVDLGTTHCALSYVDLEASDGEMAQLAVFAVPQVYGPGTVEETPLLPSFLYLPHHAELAPGDLDLPWAQGTSWAAGAFARDRGAQTPLRLVSSAKSWLCHPGVDRRAAILPPDAPDEVGRLSPLEASIRYLRHLRDAWNAADPNHPLEDQELIVTIPASFDPAARELTAEAADAAGYSGATLLEEPQAALYSWLQSTGPSWREQVTVGDVILVIDVGGGTTDLSLIAVAQDEGALVLHRVAVGDHILLGGDNMDLALAHVVAQKLAAGGTALDPWQVRALAHACRVGKESLLSDPELESAPLVVPSRSSNLIGGTVRAELTREEVAATILEGFFPQVEIAASPVGRARVGLTQLGLPYAQDPAITRHLAAFLRRQSLATAELKGFAKDASPGSTFLHPTAVLFNGGVFKARQLKERIAAILNRWLTAEQAPPARVLEATDLDLAVASGAAYYGYVRRGGGVRIRGGTAQAFYIGVESSVPAVPGIAPPVRALCLAPFGMEEGTHADLPPQEFGLVVGEPVRFRFFGSSVRREDQVGALHESWSEEEIQELEEIQVKLPAKGREPGAVVPVRLRAAVTESGVLRLEALPREGRERWKVELNTRGG
jgi:molecular chaperone DnaK (HSP70)